MSPLHSLDMYLDQSMLHTASSMLSRSQLIVKDKFHVRNTNTRRKHKDAKEKHAKYTQADSANECGLKQGTSLILSADGTTLNKPSSLKLWTCNREQSDTLMH